MGKMQMRALQNEAAAKWESVSARVFLDNKEEIRSAPAPAAAAVQGFVNQRLSQKQSQDQSGAQPFHNSDSLHQHTLNNEAGLDGQKS